MTELKHSKKRCQICRLGKPLCMCTVLRKTPCELEIIVLRHILEGRRNSNTGSLVCRSLQKARLIAYADPQKPLSLEDLTDGDTWLLYPKPGARIPECLPSRLLVVDGTWPQARRMVQRNPELYSLPCLALPPPERALPRMRKSPHPEQMSTAESVVAALRVLKQLGAAQHLEEALREMVRRISTPYEN